MVSSCWSLFEARFLHLQLGIFYLYISYSAYILSHFSRVDSLWPCGYSPPGSSVHGILQARILEWVAMPSSRGSSRPRDRTASPASPALQAGSLPTEPPGKPQPRAGPSNMVAITTGGGWLPDTWNMAGPDGEVPEVWNSRWELKELNAKKEHKLSLSYLYWWHADIIPHI